MNFLISCGLDPAIQKYKYKQLLKYMHTTTNISQTPIPTDQPEKEVLGKN